MLRLVWRLGPIDVKNIRRDSLLVWMPVIPLILAVGLRWARPQFESWAGQTFGLNLVPLYPLFASFFIPLAAMFAGLIVGFLLLDERDERTLLALAVTPITLEGYLVYRIAVPAILGTAMTLLALPLTGLVAVPVVPLVAVLVLGSLSAPILALFLATFADNKVSGLAVMKTLGGILMLPIAAFFVPPPWQFAAGVVPSFWPLQAFWLLAEGEGNFWLHLLIGFSVNLAILALLLHRFRTVMHR